MLAHLRSAVKSLFSPMQGADAAADAAAAGAPAAPAAHAPHGPVPAPQSRARAIAMVLLAFGISAVVLVLSTRFRDALLAFGQLGLIGLFVLSAIGNATVFLPAPVFVVACAAGPIYGPLATGVVAGFGSAVGEMTGYMAGYGGSVVLPQGAIYQRLVDLMQRFGPLVIFALAALPNPAFDVGGLIAGALRMHPLVFLFATALGKSLRLSLVAAACVGIINLPFLAPLGR
jgi:membrane protein YqaA with SNARE-associated domain